MPRTIFFLVAFRLLLRAEVHPMTLRQAVEIAMKQNPDITLVRLDEEKARQAIRVARDPFYPRVVVGSGLAYTNGFPMSVEGSAPSVVQANAVAYLFNRPQTFQIALARENVRGASASVGAKREEVAWRVASLYLDAERTGRAQALARKDAESLEKVLDIIRSQVREGRALPLAEKTAAFNLARARQVASALEDDQASGEVALALALGFPAEDRIHPAEEERPAPALPREEQAVQAALEANQDLRRLASQIAAKQFEIRSEKAARLPRADLVAQYGLLARFNNYDEFFRKFQRNNGQIGVSFQLPILGGPGVTARVAQAQAEVLHLRTELTMARNRLAADLEQGFRDIRKTADAAEVARLDLEVAREQVSVNLALLQEGRVTIRQVEEARMLENQKWIGFYDAQYGVEKARWNVLRLTGELVASLEALP